MIALEESRQITAKAFPNGPEELLKRLGVEVYYANLVGVEGWCIRGPRTVIRINSRSTRYRQRFTLSHELAHLVLGTEPDIATEPFSNDSIEEREADNLAAEFLIPSDQLLKHIGGMVPIDAKSLNRLANAANVSPVMAACRVVKAGDVLGITHSAVLFFRNGKEEWRYSPDLIFDEGEPSEILRLAVISKPSPVRRDNSDGRILVGSIIDAQIYQILFIQLLPKGDAHQETFDEKLRRCGKELFENDNGFQSSLAGAFGNVKAKCFGQNIEQAIAYFYEKYVGIRYKYSREQKLQTNSGKEFVRLSLSKWFS